MSKVLLAADLPISVSAAGRQWVRELTQSLISEGHDVHIHPGEAQASTFHTELEELGAKVLSFTAAEGELDETRHLPRFRARAIVNAAKGNRYNYVVAQGTELCRFLAGSGMFSTKLWSIFSNSPFRSDRLTLEELKEAQRTITGAYRLILTSEENRSLVESKFPTATSRTLILPDFGWQDSKLDATPSQASRDYSGYIVDLEYFPTEPDAEFRHYASRVTELRNIPTLYLKNFSHSRHSQEWREIPGAVITEPPTSALAQILPPPWDIRARAAASRSASSRHFVPVAVGSAFPGAMHCPSIPTNLGDASRIRSYPWAAREERNAVASLNLHQRGWIRPASATTPGRAKLKLVLAGSDFKFAGDLVDYLAGNESIDFRVDLFEHHTKPQPEKSQAYVDWADVVIAEFASRNALWYADNKKSGQRLIVHLHGYELLSDWIDDLNVENVDAIVVASENYRQRAISMKGWPEDKVRVISNSVNPADLDRPKMPDSRFHIGLAGYVPTLKRPDRALDLLKSLRVHDTRYTLHLRGHKPWNYIWEWKKAAHQDSYRVFFERIWSDPILRGGVAFEPFGPDMGNWLSGIGWVLSTSTRETFHLAGVEGASSGAVPVVWSREGADEIFGDPWVHASTEEAANAILKWNKDQDSFDAISLAAKSFAEKYSAATVCAAWQSLINEHPRRVEKTTDSVKPWLSGATEADRVFRAVYSAVEDGRWEDALAELDANIPLCRSANAGHLPLLEKWVRGTFALDSRRYSIFPPLLAVPGISALRTITVRAKNCADREFARLGLELAPIELEPPQMAELFSVPVGKPAPDEVQSDKPLDLISSNPEARFDHWVEAAAGKMVSIVARQSVNQLLANGPWWLALPTGISAHRLGIPFYWFDTDPNTLPEIEKALASRTNTNPYAQLAALTASAARQYGTAADVNASPTAKAALAPLQKGAFATTCRKGEGRAILTQEFLETFSPRYPGNAEAMLRAPETIRVVTGKGSVFTEYFRRTGCTVTETDAEDIEQHLSPYNDLLIIDAALGRDAGPWRSLICTDVGKGISRAAKIFDACRGVGMVGAFAADHAGVLLDRELISARKSDLFIANSDHDLDKLLSLHPISISRIFMQQPRGEVTDHVRRLLASVGIRCALEVPQSARMQQKGDDEQSNPPASVLDHSYATRDQLKDVVNLGDEGVSVLVATRHGASRIPLMLESVAEQSLPHRLIELIIVENGEPDETAQMIKRFAKKYPKIRTLYRYTDKPGAGNARNIAISLATKKYVSFLDDDDQIEPNYLRSLWLSAAPDAIVLAPMRDCFPDGSSNSVTQITQRYRQLGDSRIPVTKQVHSLGLNGCKLLPTEIARQHRYETDLRSGEDVVFMANFLTYDLALVPASPSPAACYRRAVRPDSVSRQKPSFDFSVLQRLQVISSLERIASNHKGVRAITGAIAHLQKGQFGIMERYLKATPTEIEKAEATEPGSYLTDKEIWADIAALSWQK